MLFPLFPIACGFCSDCRSISKMHTLQARAKCITMTQRHSQRLYIKTIESGTVY